MQVKRQQLFFAVHINQSNMSISHYSVSVSSSAQTTATTGQLANLLMKSIEFIYKNRNQMIGQSKCVQVWTSKVNRGVESQIGIHVIKTRKRKISLIKTCSMAFGEVPWKKKAEIGCGFVVNQYGTEKNNAWIEDKRQFSSL